MPEEIWKDIPGYEGRYQVSDLGRVRSLPGGNRKGSVLRPGKASNGYFTVALYTKNKGPKSHLVQDLVMAAFVGPKPAGYYTRHKDDNRTHNELSNLCYGTSRENYIDVYSNGHTHGKLTETDVRNIRDRLGSCENTHHIAADYGVCERVIRNIRAGRTFAWVI